MHFARVQLDDFDPVEFVGDLSGRRVVFITTWLHLDVLKAISD